MRFAILIFFLFMSSLGLASEPFQKLALEEALRKGTAENKWVFVDFYVTWCRPCKEMDQTTWKDAEVVKLLQDRVIAIRINTDEQPEISKKYSIVVHPTLAFLSPKEGKLIDRMVGYVKPEEFKTDFRAALNGTNALQRAKEKWMQSGEFNPVARFEYAKTLEFNEEPLLALEQYAWCWDEGVKHQPSFAMMRRTFLLSEWSRLAKSHPAAREELKKRERETRTKFEDGEMSLKSDLQALTRFLNGL